MLERLGIGRRGSGADADAVLAAAVAVALAIAEQADRPQGPAQAVAAPGLSAWLLDGRRRLMDSRVRPSR